jgi:hypothetical protein
METKTEYNVGDKIILRDQEAAEYNKEGVIIGVTGTKTGDGNTIYRIEIGGNLHFYSSQWLDPAPEGERTETKLIDQKCDPDWSDLVRRRIDTSVPGETKEIFEMLHNFNQEADNWVSVPSEVVGDFVLFSQEHLTIRNLLQRFARLREESVADKKRLAELTLQLGRSGESHRRDIQIIGQRLIDESDERGWCDEFDRIIEEVNTELLVELPTRMREFEVTVTLSVTASETVTVTARDQDAAHEMVSNDANSYINFSEVINDEVVYGSGADIVEVDVYEA